LRSPFFLKRPPDAGKRQRELPPDESGVEPKHPIPEPRELPIAPSIGGTPVLVTPAVDFNHKFRARRDEVDDVVTDGHLTPKRHVELPGAQGEPELLLGLGRARAHQLGALHEQELGFGIDG